MDKPNFHKILIGKLKLKSNNTLYSSVFFLLFCSMASAQTADLIEAELVESVEPSYPKERTPRSSGEQSIDDGLVKLIYMVDQRGEPYQVMVDRTSMPKFSEEAIKSITRYQFKPAMKNAKPVDSRHSSELKFVFDEADLHDSRGNKRSIGAARRFSLPDGFKSYYDQFSEEFNQVKPDQDKLQHLLNKMAKIKHQSFYSLAYLSLARYRAAKKIDDKLGQMQALEDLIWFDEMVETKHQVLQKDLKRTVYTALLQLQIELGHYAEALDNYSKFKESDRKIGKMFKNYIGKIILLKESDQLTQRVVNIGDNGYSHLPLLKRSFVVEVDKGIINTLKLRCDTKFKEFAFRVDAQYTLPDSWGQCDLQIIGESDSVASVLQQ
jgi:hypothetical protein